MKWRYPAYVILGIFLTSCGAVQKATNHGLNDGNYRLTLPDGKKEHVYAAVSADSITTYAIPKKARSTGNVTPQIFYFTATPEHPVTSDFTLMKSEWDFDITTVLFKYRFSTNTLPAQLNANLNLAGYFGYKKEFFRFRDSKTPDNRHKTDLQHYSLDAGFFTGFGSTPMNPSTTNGYLQTEYDGFIWQYGGAVFVGWDIFTFGVGLGFDSLLDKNRQNWIYQGKPWLGLMIGLTLSN